MVEFHPAVTPDPTGLESKKPNDIGVKMSRLALYGHCSHVSNFYPFEFGERKLAELNLAGSGVPEFEKRTSMLSEHGNWWMSAADDSFQI